MIAAIVGAQAGEYNYFAEMETAGKCFEWVKDHLALDEIGIYLQKVRTWPRARRQVYTSLYDYMTETIEAIPPGSGGVIFTPWLHGNRCPFEDPNAAGMFFNIRLDTGKTEMIRAVLEGICFHLRWMLECQDKKAKDRRHPPLRRRRGACHRSPANVWRMSPAAPWRPWPTPRMWARWARPCWWRWAADRSPI